jgi:hypothetical protein
LAKPPAFSPPKYAVWVDSLWLLALVISLIGAMLVTLEQRFVRQYVILTQNKDYSPETRAWFHAKVADGGMLNEAENSYLFCLHLSLALFAAGLLIYFFDINRATFGAVVWFIAITTVAYALFSVLPIYSRNFLGITPFSPMPSPGYTSKIFGENGVIEQRGYLAALYAIAQVFSLIKPLHGLSIMTRKHHRALSDRCRVGIVEGNAKWLKEEALKPSSKNRC